LIGLGAIREGVRRLQFSLGAREVRPVDGKRKTLRELERANERFGACAVGESPQRGQVVAAIDRRNEDPLFAYCGLLAWNFSASSFRFAVNSSAVVGDQATKLENVVKTFKGAESSPGVADTRSIQTPVVLTGRASATGDPAHNQELSEQRAGLNSESVGERKSK